MIDKVFLDTNILIYAVDTDSRKKELALSLVLANPLISVQVVNECSNVLRKRFKLDYDRIVEIINNYLKTVVLVPVNLATVKLAWYIGKRYQYTYYDSLIIASALENHCNLLYSEDLQHRQVIESRLQVVNPFL